MVDRSQVAALDDLIPFRELVETDSDHGVALFDPELRVVYANPAARAVLHPADGAVVVGLRDSVARHRDRRDRSDGPPSPTELVLGSDPTGRARATISTMRTPKGTWFVVRLSPPGGFSEPTVRRLQARFRLTLREAQVAVAVAKGLANGEVAESLGIREKTVKNALMAVFLKCRVRNRVELALKAHEAAAHE